MLLLVACCTVESSSVKVVLICLQRMMLTGSSAEPNFIPVGVCRM